MARLYADQNFPARVVELLRNLTHDVITAKEAGNAGVEMSDEDVLAFAHSHSRAILTVNRSDFVKLHDLEMPHSGIIICAEDMDREKMARQINESIFWVSTLRGNLIKVKSYFVA